MTSFSELKGIYVDSLKRKKFKAVMVVRS